MFWIAWLPGPLRRWLKRISAKRNIRRYRHLSTEEIFTDIFKRKQWAGGKSISGPGSDDEQTQIIRNYLPLLLKEKNIHTLLDIPCGDFNWMSKTDLGHTHCIAADIVPDLIEKNKRTYHQKNIEFRKLDLIRDELPACDLILVRDCLVHLSTNDIFRSVNNMRRSGSAYLLCTTFTGQRENQDIITGNWRPLNLQLPPFSFPEPLKIINEECKEGNGEWSDKSLGLWKISDLPHYPV